MFVSCSFADTDACHHGRVFVGESNAEQLRRSVRESVLERLHGPVDDREAASIARFIDCYDGLDHPFTEGSAITHVTGSAIVVGARGVLLHLHKRAQIWIQPGGHVDAGETPWEGAARETFEETGLMATQVGPNGAPVLIHVDVHDAPKGHVHLDLRYLLIGPDQDPAPPAGESQQVGWFEWDDPLMNRDSLVGAINASRSWLAEYRPHLLHRTS